MRCSILCFSVLLVSCSSVPLISPHKIDVQQGNVVDQEMVSKLKPGMTRSQVRFVLGTPLVADPFHADRWDYVYRYQKAGELTQSRKLSVIFEEDKLVRVEGDVVPATSAATDLPKRAAVQPVPAKPAVSELPRKTTQPKPAPAEPEKKPGVTEKLGRMLGLGEAESQPPPVMLKNEERRTAPQVTAETPGGREQEARQERTRLAPKPAAVPAEEKIAKEEAPAAGSRPWEGGTKPWEGGGKPWESGDGKLRNREGKTVGEQVGELFSFSGSESRKSEGGSAEDPRPQDGKLRNREGKTIGEQIRDLFRFDDEESPPVEARPAREQAQPTAKRQPEKDTTSEEAAAPRDNKLRNREGKTIGEQIRDLFRSENEPAAAVEPKPSPQATSRPEPAAPASPQPSVGSDTQPKASTEAQARPSAQSPSQRKSFLQFLVEDILGFDEEWRAERQGGVK
jgi:outer membrane protein assembly factor BamE